MTSLQVVSGHRKNFKGTKFNCKKLFLNITLKLFHCSFWGEKKSTCSFMFRLSSFFSKQTSRGKIVFTLKGFWVFSGLTTSNPRKRKIIITILLNTGRMEERKDPVCNTLSFTNCWKSMTSTADWGHWPAVQGRKKKSQKESAVSSFVSVATNPISFSILWCYSFIWHITGIFFGVCCLVFSFS